MDNIIEIKNLTFKYSDDEAAEKVIDNLNLSICRGSFTVVLGHNGSGKSTLAKLLNGMLKANTGNVLVDGIDTTDEEKEIEIKRRVGLVFQNPDNQLVASIVEEDVAFGPENLGLDPKVIRERVDNALKAVGMSEYAKHPTHKLSGGQKQRVAIAGIIAMEPECLVLDEPTAMLDPKGRSEVIDTIKALNKEKNITIVLITHYMNEAEGADKVVVMDNGRVAMQGTPEEIFSNYRSLHKFSLAVPQTTELIYELKNNLIEINDSAITVDSCAEALYELLKKYERK